MPLVSREPSSFSRRYTLVVAKVASTVTCTSCLYLYLEKLGSTSHAAGFTWEAVEGSTCFLFPVSGTSTRILFSLRRPCHPVPYGAVELRLQLGVATDRLCPPWDFQGREVVQ